MAFGLTRFPFVRDLTGFDFGAQPSINKAQIRQIATGRFIANGEAVLVLGPTPRELGRHMDVFAGPPPDCV